MSTNSQSERPCEMSALALRWGANITKQRQLIGDLMGKPFTQSALARAVGVTQQAVAYWESGERLPGHCHIPKIARALHTQPEVLFPYGEMAA